MENDTKKSIDEEIKKAKEKKKLELEQKKEETILEEKEPKKETKEIKEDKKDIKKKDNKKNTKAKSNNKKQEVIKENNTSLETKDLKKEVQENLNILDEKSKENEELVNTKEPKKSKIAIFLLIIALLGVLYYTLVLVKGLDFNNINLIELIKPASFILISLLIILILFKSNTKSNILIFLLVLVILGYTFISTSSSLEDNIYVKDFINHNITEVMDWASENNLKLVELHEFSDTIPKNHVILQEYGITTLVSEIDTFTVTISDGPNYAKEIIVDNLTGFTFDEVMKYIEDNHLSNVEIEFIKSSVTRDTVIEQIGSGSLKRNDKIIFRFSYGPDELEPTPVKDLKGLTEFQATAYLKRYAINYEIEYQYSNEIEKGYVMGQSVKDEIVTDKLKLTISKGAQIKVPNIKNMTSSEITKWAIENNIKVEFIEEYNKNYKSGSIIKSNYESGALIDEDTTLTITISKGSMTVPEITNLAEFKIWAQKYNVLYEEEHEFSNDYKLGEIMKVTPKVGEVIDKDDKIIITISSGKQITVPSFIGMSRSNIEAKCKSLNLTCTFTYSGYTESTNRDIALKQSRVSGTVVAEGTNVLLTLSSGKYVKVTVPNFIGKTKNQITSSCNSIGIVCNFTYASNYSNEARDTAVKQSKTGTVNKGSTITITLSQGPAKSFTFTITGELLSQGNPEQTKSTLQKLLKEKCPGVNFTFSFQASNYGKGILAENSQVHVGQNTFIQGKTYKVIIYN